VGRFSFVFEKRGLRKFEFLPEGGVFVEEKLNFTVFSKVRRIGGQSLGECEGVAPSLGFPQTRPEGGVAMECEKRSPLAAHRAAGMGAGLKRKDQNNRK
jgi:hypothetical protein